LRFAVVGPRVSLLFGYAALLSIFIAASLFILNRLNPKQGKNRIKIHCLFGSFGLICSTINIYFGPQSSSILSNVLFGLLAVIVATGFVLRYVKSAGILRYQSSTIHPGIVLALFFILLLNWLSTSGLI
jgi:hypothetical protein